MKLNKKENTHKLIITKAAELFNTKGFSGTSLSDIMNATGLKKGGIYSHFKSKTEISLACFDYFMENILNSFNIDLNENKSMIDKLLTLLDLQEKLYNKEFLSGGCPILNTGIEADDNNPDLLIKVKKFIDRWKKSISDIIKIGIKNGEIDNKINPDEFASNYIAMIEGGNFLSKIYNNQIYRSNIIKQLKKIIKNELTK